MVYDLEDHSAKFKHLSIDRFTLMTTDSGHPAIPVTPKRVPGLKWPSPQQWGNYGVIILPSAESQYVAFMTSSPKLSEGTAQEPVEHPRADRARSAPDSPGHNIFHPKKINSCARNLLCAEPLNPQHFATCWSQTGLKTLAPSSEYTLCPGVDCSILQDGRPRRPR